MQQCAQIYLIIFYFNFYTEHHTKTFTQDFRVCVLSPLCHIRMSVSAKKYVCIWL